MFKPTIIFSVLLTFFFVASNFAQEEEDNWDWAKDFNFDFHVCTHEAIPFMETNYGKVQFRKNDFGSKIDDHYFVELKLGSAEVDSIGSGLFKYNDAFFFVSNIATNLNYSGDKENLPVEITDWRFGAAGRSAFGYKIGFFSFVPYREFGGGLSRITIKTFPSLSNQFLNYSTLDRFGDSFRFGLNNEAGLLLGIGEHVNFNIGYEFSSVYPRFMTWEFFGSVLIQIASDSMLGNFLDEVEEHSPVAMPVVNFLLRNALDYAFFSLRKEKMNWPFESEAPLTLTNFKIGISFVF